MPIPVEKLKGLDQEFAKRLQAAVAAAEAATGSTAQITDAYRDARTQAQYYANYTQKPVTFEGVTYKPQKQGGLAAPPGRSRHQGGAAVDIRRGPVLSWLHENAGDFGLEFLKGNAFKRDPVHIQMAGGAAPNLPAAIPPIPTLRPPTQTASLTPPIPALRPTLASFTPPASAPPAPPQMPSGAFTAAAGNTRPGSLSELQQALGIQSQPPLVAQNDMMEGGGGFTDYRDPVPQAYGEMFLTNTGPYGFGELINAIVSGAPQAQIDAIGDRIAAQIDALPTFGLGANKAGAKIDLENYIKNVVPQQAPGAVRYLREQFATNPDYAALVPDALKGAMEAAFRTQLPPTTTVPVAMPNLRPPMPAGAPPAPPLVADTQPPPLVPRMASFVPPPSQTGLPSGNAAFGGPDPYTQRAAYTGAPGQAEFAAEYAKWIPHNPYGSGYGMMPNFADTAENTPPPPLPSFPATTGTPYQPSSPGALQSALGMAPPPSLGSFQTAQGEEAADYGRYNPASTADIRGALLGMGPNPILTEFSRSMMPPPLPIYPSTPATNYRPSSPTALKASLGMPFAPQADGGGLQYGMMPNFGSPALPPLPQTATTAMAPPMPNLRPMVPPMPNLRPTTATAASPATAIAPPPMIPPMPNLRPTQLQVGETIYEAPVPISELQEYIMEGGELPDLDAMEAYENASRMIPGW